MVKAKQSLDEWLYQQYGFYKKAERPIKAASAKLGYLVFYDQSNTVRIQKDILGRGLGEEVLSPLTGEKCIFLSVEDIRILQASYKQCQKDTVRLDETAAAKESLEQLGQLQALLSSNASLRMRVHQAMQLCADRSNGHLTQRSISDAEVTSANGLCIDLFAQLYRDQFSELDYQKIRCLSLRWSTIQGNVFIQGLKTDSNFVEHLMQETAQWGLGHPTINEKIEANITYLLHGCPYVSLGGNKSFEAQRFLPDLDNAWHSQTDELFLHAGGRRDHYALIKIKKMPMNSQGRPIVTGEKIHYYD